MMSTDQRRQLAGLHSPETTSGPDGEHVILPPSQWSRSASSDFLLWDTEHYEVGPRAASASHLIGPAVDCGDCVTQQRGPTSHCAIHACRAANAKGVPCKAPASPYHGLMYCKTHGCSYELSSGVRCPERVEKRSFRCAGHQEPQANSGQQ
jgi:hypothetical protein